MRGAVVGVRLRHTEIAVQALSGFMGISNAAKSVIGVSNCVPVIYCRQQTVSNEMCHSPYIGDKSGPNSMLLAEREHGIEYSI